MSWAKKNWAVCSHATSIRNIWTIAVLCIGRPSGFFLDSETYLNEYLTRHVVVFALKKTDLKESEGHL